MSIQDESATWRIVYRVDPDGIVIVDLFAKKTQRTPAAVIARFKARLKIYDEVSKGR